MDSSPLPLILLVEDEETDIYFFQRALKQAQLANPLMVASNGKIAVEYLTGNPPFADRSQHPLPGLLVLDLKMPQMNGFDVLKWLKDQTALQHLPTIILTSSTDEADKEKALQLGASEYCIKPHCPDKLVDLIRELHARWLAKEEFVQREQS